MLLVGTSEEDKSTMRVAKDIINEHGAMALLDGALANAIRLMTGHVAVRFYDKIVLALLGKV